MQSDWITASEHAQTRSFATSSHAHFREHDLSPRDVFHSRFTLEYTDNLYNCSRPVILHCIVQIYMTMASANVTVFTEVDIVSDLLKKSFSARQPSEQNIIINQRPMPNLQVTTGDRSFQESWYTKKDWLCGSAEKKAMFCWPCLLFCPGTSSSWTKTGFKNMKGFLSDCKKHEKAKSHMSAYKTWKTYGSGPRVDSHFTS